MGNTLSDRIKGYANESFETLFHPSNAISRACSSVTLAQVEAKIAFAAEITGKAQTFGDIGSFLGLLGEAGRLLKNATDKLDKWLSKGKDLSGDVSAGCEIFKAVGVLSDWSTKRGSVSNQDAAVAFDELFEGLATYVKSLPFEDAMNYGDFLAEWGKRKMFSQTAKNLEWQGGNKTDAWDSVNDALGK